MKNSEQPAFPKLQEQELNQNSASHGSFKTIGGLTKREYFAGKVVNGLLASENEESYFAPTYKLNKDLTKGEIIESRAEKIANETIRITDELLKQLEK